MVLYLNIEKLQGDETINNHSKFVDIHKQEIKQT